MSEKTKTKKEEMKMKVRKLTALTVVLLFLLSLTACGASSQKTESAMGYNYAADMAPQEPMAEAEMEMVYSEEKASNSLSSENGTTAEVPAQRKWIITMDISAETEDLDGLLEASDSCDGNSQTCRRSCKTCGIQRKGKKDSRLEPRA